MKFDKQKLKQEMLKLEEGRLAFSEHAYEEYLRSARHDRSEAADHQQLAQESESSVLAQYFECPIHDHEKAIALLKAIDFGPKDEIVAGSLVKFNDQWFAISVATQNFTHHGVPFIGVSTEAPIFKAIKGLEAGDTFELKGREVEIQEVL